MMDVDGEMEPKFKHGWKTLNDGSRVAVSEDEATELWAYVQSEAARRAEAYPKTGDVLRAFCDAEQRLKDLGWKAYTFGLDDGTEVAVVERGSTGIFHGVWSKPYFHYADCVTQAGKILWKPVEDLTEDEAQQMDKCSKDHAEYMEGQFAMLSRLQDAMGGGGE